MPTDVAAGHSSSSNRVTRGNGHSRLCSKHRFYINQERAYMAQLHHKHTQSQLCIKDSGLQLS